VLDALQTTFGDMLAGRVKIITSDAYRGEVFGKDHPEGQAIAEQFEACPYFEIVPLRTQAWDMAGEMRKRCRAARPPRSLTLGDALHIVGGTMARVDEIWTTDSKLVRYHEDGLLSSVKVCLPYLKQLKIGF
jgi:hypothetical protein